MPRLLVGALLTWAVDAANIRRAPALAGSPYVPNPQATGTGGINASNVKKREDTVPVKHKRFNVTIMAFKHTDFVSDKLRRNGDWDGDAVSRFCSYFEQLGSRGSFVDARAGIGTYALPVASCMRKRGGRVVAVEERPQVAGNLRWGMKYNKLDNVRLYQYELGAHTAGESTWSKEWHKKMPVTTLDAILEAEDIGPQKVFGMRLDLEGQEASALYGASKLFKEHGPCVLFIQLQYDPVVGDLLRGMGYVRKATTPTWGNHWFEKADLDRCADALAAKDP